MNPTLSSKLFPYLFSEEWLEGKPCLKILDLGPALSDSIAFFSQLRCHLHIVDLFSEPPISPPQDDLSLQEIQLQFEQLLDFPPDTCFDICLFWDLPNYLDNTAITALNNALKPYLDNNTMGHCFTPLKKNTPLVYQQYGIVQADTLRVMERSDPPQSYPHSQAELKKLLACFDTERGMLLPNGRLEILLRSIVN